MSSIVAKYLTPWKHKRQLQQQRLAALRGRDGDDCRRCRRPMRFDLPDGHDLGPKVEQFSPAIENEAPALENLCLTHRRCNTEPADFTSEVKERIRRKNEADLFANSRVKRQA